jgi:hypothetical protein
MAFDKGRNIAVLRSRQQIAFPMARYRAIFSCSRSIPDRHHIRDFSTPVGRQVHPPRSADRALRAKMLEQLLFKHTARLHK